MFIFFNNLKQMTHKIIKEKKEKNLASNLDNRKSSEMINETNECFFHSYFPFFLFSFLFFFSFSWH